MEISDKGIHFIEKEEGCKLVAYADPKGIWTIGTGHTGPDVHKGLSITKEEADRLLRNDLIRFVRVVNGVCDGVETTQNQFDAMVSLAFNIGVSAFRTSSIARFHRTKQFSKAGDAFLAWKRSGRNPSLLLPRRQRERSIYFTP